MLVIDASVALTWCFEDEASDETDAVLDRVTEKAGVVPALWHLEILNSLLQAEKRNRISFEEIFEKIDMFNILIIETDCETGRFASREILLLAHRHKLSAYDAAYLELAFRRGLPLATRDKALIVAARSLGITVL